ncbi:MAG TPA: nucleotide disphospho-sugar-binding domain-containing protein [Acidimicrobiales bacterium]|nr:nucleotide disphospho-sugar-binding domain-containing protein [Acidimicrobiales bacterium]
MSAPSAPAEGGRFLFVVPPLAGHVNPTVPVGQALADRGHAVAWAGHTEPVASLLPPGAGFLPVADAIPPEVAAAVEEKTGRVQAGAASITGVWEDYVLPVARQMAPGVHAAVDAFAPDVLVVDQQALAGAAVAELRGLVWATSATTPAELVPMPDIMAKLREWLAGVLAGLMVDLGVEPARAARFEPRFSPHLVLAFTTSYLVGQDRVFPPQYALVGPSIGARPDDTPFPWEWIDGARPLVLVSLGTVNWRAGERFFRVVADALAGLDAQAVVVAPPELVPEPPPNVLVRARVPQLALLPKVDAVVCHGGNNTVCESLAEGRPLVVAPMRDDQPFIADQVARVGAGIRVRFKRVTPSSLAEALGAVLADPTYRAAAERVRESFTAAGGPAAAADRLEDLLATVRQQSG